jgi:tetratricopeptide (TPR) repeat protein
VEKHLAKPQATLVSADAPAIWVSPRNSSSAAQLNCSPVAHRRWAAVVKALVAAGMLIAAVALVFGQMVRNEFNYVYDDNDYILLNPFVKQGLSLRSIAWAFSSLRASNWHPLTWISHMLDCQMFGLWAGGHHLTSGLLHCATTVMLFLALRAMTARPWASALVVAIFAVHPLRAESVAWAAERKDVLSGFFFACALWTYVEYVRHPKSLFWYMSLVVIFALGLLAKPMLVTLPLVLLLLDFWPMGRMERRGIGDWGLGIRDTQADVPENQTLIPQSSSWAQSLPALLIEKLPLFVLSATSSVVTLVAQQEAMASVRDTSIPFRSVNAMVSYAAYLRDTVCPEWLAPLYQLPTNSWPTLLVVASAVILTAISALAVVLRRRQPWLLFGWLWYLIVLVPVIGLVQVGVQTRADRYTYLALIGPTIACVWSAAQWLATHRHYRPAASAAVAVLLAMEMAAGWHQAALWHDCVALWGHAIATGNDTPLAETSLGRALYDQHEPDEAFPHLFRAIEIDPPLSTAFTNLGTAFARSKQPDKAMEYYLKAAELDPRDIKIQQNLGQTYTELGKTEEALAHYRRAAELKPEIAASHYNLAFTLAALGQLTEAVHEYEVALRLQSDYALAANNLANIDMQLGRTDDALARYRQAIASDPGMAEAHNNLGLLLMRRGERSEAIEHFQQALQIQPGYAQAHNNLGVVLAGERHFAEAAKHFQKAAELEPTNAFAHANLGRALNHLGKNSAATAELRKAVQLNPVQPTAMVWLAWVLATAPDDDVRNGSEAVALAEKALQMVGNSPGSADPSLHDTLAAAYAEAGRWKDAVAEATRAESLAGKVGNQALAGEIRSRLELYRAGKAYRAP